MALNPEQQVLTELPQFLLSLVFFVGGHVQDPTHQGQQPRAPCSLFYQNPSSMMMLDSLPLRMVT